MSPGANVNILSMHQSDTTYFVKIMQSFVFRQNTEIKGLTLTRGW